MNSPTAERYSGESSEADEVKSKNQGSCYHPFQSGFDTGLGKNLFTDRTAEGSSTEIELEKKNEEDAAEGKGYAKVNAKTRCGGRGNNSRENCHSGDFRPSAEAIGHPAFSLDRSVIFKRQYPGSSTRLDRVQMNPVWFYPDFFAPAGSDLSRCSQTIRCSRILPQNCGVNPHQLDRRSERMDFRKSYDGSSLAAAVSTFQTGYTCSNSTIENLKGPSNVGNVMTPGRSLCQDVQKAGGGRNRPMVCNFCKNNKEVPDIYMNHYLYDPKTKKLTCPVLRKHVCEICGETGDRAHTLQYCPINRQRGLQAKVPVLLKTRTITNSTGKIRRN